MKERKGFVLKATSPRINLCSAAAAAVVAAHMTLKRNTPHSSVPEPDLERERENIWML